MGLADDVAAAIADAQEATAELAVPVTVTPVTLDGEGTEVPGAAVTYQAFVERRRMVRRLPDGRMVETDSRVLFLESVEVGMSDRLADDAGDLGPVLYVGGFRRRGGGTLYTEAWMGGTRGNALGTQ